MRPRPGSGRGAPLGCPFRQRTRPSPLLAKQMGGELDLDSDMGVGVVHVVGVLVTLLVLFMFNLRR